MYSAHVLITRISELIYEALGILPGIAGTRMLERRLFHVWGRSLLAAFERSVSTWRSKWSAFFQRHGVTSSTYTIDRIDTSNQTYTKLSVHRSKAYVGATTTGLCVREEHRKRKFKQNTDQVEPAIRWWRKYANFGNSAPPPFENAQSRRRQCRSKSQQQESESLN